MCIDESLWTKCRLLILASIYVREKVNNSFSFAHAAGSMCFIFREKGFGVDVLKFFLMNGLHGLL